MIAVVVAHDHNLAIGKNGWMPWHLPEDLKCFRSITLHHTIVMGRTTFDAMKKPLPDRKTIVVTHNKDYVYDHPDVEIVHDFDQLIQQYENSAETLMICGGAHIYTQALPYVKEMWISLVDGVHEADTYFPAYRSEDFIVQSREEKEGFTLIHYLRK